MEDERHGALRRQLVGFGYNERFDLESLELVEHLFTDLVRYKNDLLTTKSLANKSQRDKDDADSVISAYKSDNGRLVKENNDLRRELILLKEEYNQKFTDIQDTLAKVHKERASLQFLKSQYSQKINALEKDSYEKSGTILQFQTKNLQPVIQTPAGKKIQAPFRRQRMEVDSFLKPSTSTPQNGHEDPEVVNVLQMADLRIHQLHKEAEDLNGLLQKSTATVELLKQGIEIRDAEIHRLSTLLEGGRPEKSVLQNGKVGNSAEELIHLRKENEALREQLQLMERKNYAASQRNGPSSNANANRVRKVNMGIHQRRADELEREYDKLQKDHEIVNKAKQELLQLQALTNEKLRLEETVRQVTTERDHLLSTVRKLNKNEKDLLLEIDRLSKFGKGPPPSASTSHFLSAIRFLESERDQYKEEVKYLHSLLESNGIDPNRSSRASDANSSPDMSDHRPTRPLKNLSASEAALLEQERDMYKEKYLQKSSELQKLLAQNKNLRPEAKADELTMLLQEKDTLLKEVRDRVNTLTRERDELNRLYRETLTKIRKTEDEYNEIKVLYEKVCEDFINIQDTTVPKRTGSTSSSEQPLKEHLHRLLKQREEAFQKLHEAENAIEFLRREKEELQQKAQQSEEKLREEEQIHSNTQATLISHQTLIRTQKNQIENLQLQLKQLQGEIRSERTASDQMRSLADQAQGSSKVVEEKRRDLEMELQEYRRKMELLEGEIDRLKNQLNQQQAEAAGIKKTVNALDQHRDQLQMESDAQSEKIAQLESMLKDKESQARSLELIISTMESQIDEMQGDLRERNQELATLKQQMNRQNEELVGSDNNIQTLREENQRLNDNLTTMAREHQHMSADLEKSLREQENLRIQIQEYVTEVKRVEELLQLKEKERNDLLEQFKNLTVTNIELESQTQNLESQQTSVQVQLQTKDIEIERYREIVQSLEHDLNYHIHLEKTYQEQASTLKATVESLEMELQQKAIEIAHLQNELANATQLKVGLDSSLDNLQQRLNQEEAEKQALLGKILSLEEDLAVARNEASAARSSNASLENLLTMSREREYMNEVNYQKFTSEIKNLQDHLQATNNHIDAQNQENSSLKNQVAEFQNEVEQLKRQITNERFEREKTRQELRKLQQHAWSGFKGSITLHSLTGTLQTHMSLSPEQMQKAASTSDILSRIHSDRSSSGTPPSDYERDG